MRFSASMWELVEQHTGISPYLLRADRITPAMLAKMRTHQEDLARAFDLSFAQAHWLLFTVAYYCVAVADTVLPLTARPRNAGSNLLNAAGAVVTDAAYAQYVRQRYAQGSRALVVGALAMLGQMDDASFPPALTTDDCSLDKASNLTF